MIVPEWVTSAVGIYAILGSIFFLVAAVVGAALLRALIDLSRQMKSLTTKVGVLTDRVNSVAQQVDSITSDVGVRTKGIVRLVDEHTSNALRILEVAGPVLVLVGAVMRMRRIARRR